MYFIFKEKKRKEIKEDIKVPEKKKKKTTLLHLYCILNSTLSEREKNLFLYNCLFGHSMTIDRVHSGEVELNDWEIRCHKYRFFYFTHNGSETYRLKPR